MLCAEVKTYVTYDSFVSSKKLSHMCSCTYIEKRTLHKARLSKCNTQYRDMKSLEYITNVQCAVYSLQYIIYTG